MISRLIALLAATLIAVATATVSAPGVAGGASYPVVTTRYSVPRPRGLMVTSGGWAYCQQARPVARATGYTLLCGRYAKDGYLGPGLRSRRHLDWGAPRYLADFADAIRAEHRRVGGSLVLLGVSYAGFGVAVLASRHPELHPDQLIVVDSYLDLLARRRKLPDSHETAREIDLETGGSAAALRDRSVSVDGLARLVEAGTRLTVVWSVSDDEQRFFRGATCDRTANAETLSLLARRLGRPVRAWVTQNRHGVDLWRYGTALVRGTEPGRAVTFLPDGVIPPASVCR